jgi:TatD DNase family protein
VLVDTHCHLGDAQFDPDRDAVLRRAGEGGVGHIIVIADSLAASRTAVSLSSRPGLSATAGVHPHVASGWGGDATAQLSDLLHDPAVVAVGEVGLDYHYEHSPRSVQRDVFAAQLALAADRRMPVVVHARKADSDMAAMLLEWGSRIPAVVLHSFSSGPRVVEAGMAIGAYFSFSGMVTFRSWTLTDVVAACPPDRLLLETDAPYLAPVPHRGKRNEPAFVRHVAQRVAEIRGVSLQEVTALTTANAGRCLGSRVAALHDGESHA